MKTRLCFVSNCSSSSFVCTSEHTKEEVTKWLEFLTDFWTEWSMLNVDFLDMFELPFEATKSYIREMNNDWGPLYQPIQEGQIIIESYRDNSIPYELFDLIERKFEAFRIHRG